MQSTRILVRRDPDRLWRTSLDERGHPTWQAAYAAAEQVATAKRRLRALAEARNRLLRQLAEQHRPVLAPYPEQGFHLVRCRVCDGGAARLWLDGAEPFACRLWWEAVRARVVAP